MKYVGVIHKSSPKEFIFGVPSKFENKIYPGISVLCKTKRNDREYGIVQNIYDADTYQGNSPKKQVVAVETLFPIAFITIPEHFSATIPGKSKMDKRRNEYENFGEFRTTIIVNAAGLLLDGYTAYLVAKEKGLTNLRLFITG